MLILAPIVALAFLLASLGIGSLSMRFIDRRDSIPFGARVLFAFGLGAGVIAHLTLLMGLVGLARWTGWLLTGATLVCLPSVSHPLIMALRERFRSIAANPSIASGIAFVLLIVLAAITFLGALTPPFLYDALEYHIAGPLRWLRTGSVGVYPGNVYANMPCETEMLYTAAMSALTLAPDWVAQRAPSLIHWLFGVGAVSVAWAIMKRLGVTSPIRWATLVLLVLHPVAFKTTFDAYIDLAVTFWIGLSLLAWLEWRARGERGAFALMSFFLGLALCAKLTVASLYAPAVLLILIPTGVFHRRDNFAFKQVPFFVCAFGAIVVVVYLPWLIRAWTATGNPFFPALCDSFPTSYWSAEQTEAFLASHGRTTPLRAEYWLALAKRLHQPGYWAIIPCLLALASQKTDGRRPLAAWCLLVYALWNLALNSADRFMLPALMAGAPVAAAVIDDAWKRKLEPFVVLAPILIALAIQPSISSLRAWTSIRPWKSLGGKNAHRLWQAQAISPPQSARAAFALNDRFPDARVLLLFEARFSLFDVDAVGSTLFDRNALIEALDGHTINSSNDIREVLRADGFTHVLFNENDLRLFISLFTQGAYDAARAGQFASQPPEDFHLPFMNDARYGPLRTPLLQFLRECRENSIIVEFDENRIRPIICISDISVRARFALPQGPDVRITSP